MGRSFPDVESMMTYSNIGLFGPLFPEQSVTVMVTNSVMNFPNGFSKSCLCLLYFDTVFSFCYVRGPAFPEGRPRLLSGLKKPTTKPKGRENKLLTVLMA